MKIKNMNNAGTTLVELMVYMIVGLIVITGALKVISNATGSYVHGRAVSKAQFGARDGVSAMSRDISSMGFKTYFTEESQPKMKEDKFAQRQFSYTNNNTDGDTLEFYRIRINSETGRKDARERVKYYLKLDESGNIPKNTVVRILSKFELDDPAEVNGTTPLPIWIKDDTIAIASNVVALKFQFAVRGDGSDWASGFPNDKNVEINTVRNVQISMLVKSDKNESATYGAATYDVGGYTYDTQGEVNSVYRLYQVAVEVPNNGIE
ncbi:MAG: PilW family protein [Chitinivibrionia bacterium]|nr:PilW family protein [Chitinivibrionia bacterium]